jgi:hypothetical protein
MSMGFRRTAALAVVIFLSGAATAAADAPVQPRPGVLLTGAIKFPRAQQMSIQTGDGVKLAVAMGFDGRCRGGGLGELWAANVRSTPDVAVTNGRFAASLTGVIRNLGKVNGRSGHFRWRLVGRFVERGVVVATVSGSAEVRSGGRVISRCSIARATSVRLTQR